MNTWPPVRSPLTPREEDALTLIARGCTYKEAALQLGLTVSGMRSRISNAMTRLGARDGTSAVLAWLRSDQHVAAVADNLADKHPRLSRNAWHRVARIVADELISAAVDHEHDREAA